VLASGKSSSFWKMEDEDGSEDEGKEDEGSELEDSELGTIVGRKVIDLLKIGWL